MRITGGEWRGRMLSAPKGDAVRPTQDRVREALFSMMQNEIRGALFLDMFAGAGTVGLDALSRGAARATFVEIAPRHLACIRANVSALKAEDRCEVVRGDALSWASSAGAERGYSIAYADPPYAIAAEKGFTELLDVLSRRNVVRPGGYFIAETGAGQAPERAEGWELLRDRVYGQTRIALYRRTQTPAEAANPGTEPPSDCA